MVRVIKGSRLPLISAVKIVGYKIAILLIGFCSLFFTTAYAQVPITGVAKVATGYSHTCALTVSGNVKCWGDNQYGQLGFGDTIRYSVTVVDVAGLQNNVIAIASGEAHTCALTSEGRVMCWGRNDTYQMGDGTFQSRFTPVIVNGLENNIISISATDSHSCALTAAGAVKCWGYNNFAYRPAAVDIAGLDADIIAITTGVHHVCGLTNTGTVKCWGDNFYGQLGTGNTIDQNLAVDVIGLNGVVEAVEAGGHHTCALLNDGAVKCWGLNTWGQLGDSSIQQSPTPIDLPFSGDAIASLSAGFGSSCLVSTSGAVKCWGSNTNGQLGNNAIVNSPGFVDVFGLSSGISQADMGRWHACSVNNSGRVDCWGSNSYGRLGDGTTIQRIIPSPANTINSTLPLNCPSLNMTIGYSANGIWGQVGDCTAGIRGGNFKTDAYTFSAQAGRRVAISVRRGSTQSFNPYVYLRDANGQVIAQDEDGYYDPIATRTPDARIPAKWGYFTLPSSGLYTIEVTTSDVNSVSDSPYILSITSDTANPPNSSSSSARSSTASACPPAVITTFGATINGALASADCTTGARGSSYYTDRYSFFATAGQQVSIALNSTAFDAFLNLIGTNNTVLTSNDDGGGGGNSRIPATTGYYTIPVTGTYIVEATSYSTFRIGTYSLVVSTVSSSSNQSRSNQSSSSSGNSSNSWNNGGTSSNSSSSSISSSALSMSSLVASSITSSSSTANGCGTATLSNGVTHSGSLTLTDCVNGTRGTSYYTDFFSFSGTPGQQVSIQLTSTAFDTYLYLKNSNGPLITYNDDGGGGTNSRIPASSGFFTLPANPTGIYTIEVSSYSNLKTGSYNLILNTQ